MKIIIEGKEISIQQVNEQDYISLTDMVRGLPNPSMIIQNWLRPMSTIEFLILWEKMNNANFNLIESDYIRNESGGNTFTLSVKNWTDRTGAIGIVSKPGRYGGTYAHRDIAFEFGSFISPSFRFLLIRDYQRLKSKESENWNYSRFLSKVNYSLHTDSIKRNIVPKLGKGDKPHIFASEADLLNVAVFGMTAKEYREQFPDSKGNLREAASIRQLTVMANMESMNSYLIEAGASQEARFAAIYKEAQRQLEVFDEDRRLGE